MTEMPHAYDKRKCFVYVDQKGNWVGPLSRAQIIDQIKAGTITWMTPIWDHLLKRWPGPPNWLPAWVALGFPADPESPVHQFTGSGFFPNRDVWTLKPAVDLDEFLKAYEPKQII